jgi:hypothetical protein
LGQTRDTELREEGSRMLPFTESAFGPNMTKFRATVFPTQTYLWPQYAFIYWVSEIRPAYEPSLDEVRDQVILAWKRIRALELTLAAADKEASKAKAAPGQSLAEVCLAQGRVFYGPLDVEWITTGSVPTGAGAIPRLGSIPDVKGTTEETLRTIFRMKPDDVGVITDAGKLNVYVVRLVSEAPSGEIRRNVFLRDRNWYETVVYMKEIERQEQLRSWYVELLQRKKVQWQREPSLGLDAG